MTRRGAGAPLIVNGRLFVVEDTGADYGGKVAPAGWARVRSMNDAKMKLVKLGFDAHEARTATEKVTNEGNAPVTGTVVAEARLLLGANPAYLERPAHTSTAATSSPRSARVSRPAPHTRSESSL